MIGSLRRPTRQLRLALVIASALVVSLPSADAASARTAGPADGTATPPAAPAPGSITLTKVVGGLDKPVFVTSARDGSGRLFIVEQTGRIRILDGGRLRSSPFLNLSASVSKGSEQGLLGLAFHPRFSTNRRFFVNYTNTSGDTVIREYRASATDPNRVASGSGRTIIRINQPYANHNGGMIAFGRDGYLYIGTGDGGSGGDPGNRAQNKGSLLGKMLRINVNGSTSTRNYLIPSSNPYVGKPGRNEIWQRGLRNPWRWSFDRSTGNLWIGDVGQRRYEEVDRAVRTSSGPGRGVNWGWRVMEGRHCYLPSSGCNRTGKKLPLVEYSHASNGRCAVTGGYVYRGSAVAALRGWYVYGDYCSGEIFAVAAGASSPASPVRLLDTGLLISSFGESAGGELYVVDLAGTLYRVGPA
jgi:glucose/arabinose dehydrogenase